MRHCLLRTTAQRPTSTKHRYPSTSQARIIRQAVFTVISLSVREDKGLILLCDEASITVGSGNVDMSFVEFGYSNPQNWYIDHASKHESGRDGNIVVAAEAKDSGHHLPQLVHVSI